MTTELTTTKDGQIQGPRRASEVLAEHLALDADTMIRVIKGNCFGGTDPAKVSNEQLAAFVNVAHDLATRCPGFNPLLPGMLYAYPKQGGGIQPMLGPDGVFAMLSQRADFDGIVTETVNDERGNLKAVKASIYIKGRERPASYEALLSEWTMGSNPNWKSRPTHMLTIRAIKQAARQVIHGIPLDADEVRIIQAEAGSYSSTVADKAEELKRQLASEPEAAAEHEERGGELFGEEGEA